MKKKIIAFLGAIAIAMSLLSITSVPANAATGITCYNGRMATAHTTFAYGKLPKTTFAFETVVGYQKCINRYGADWVRPQWVRVSVYTKRLNCYSHIGEQAIDAYQVTPYFWDHHAGVNYRKTRWSFDCDEDGTASGIRHYGPRTTPRLYFDADNGNPKFRINVSVNWRIHPDPDGFMVGTFR